MTGSGSVEGTSVETTSVGSAPAGSAPAGGTSIGGTSIGSTWCDHCGGAAAEGRHDACVAARALEPPRYCPHCRRRMKVQVLPAGWSAVCVAHGATGPDR